MIKTFTQKVYEVIRKIPKGKVLAYKEVARLAGSPKASRAVGNILHKNHDSEIPCHRVIRSDGNLGGFNKGTVEKRRKLKEEGSID
jgi:O-6-methylguanine DNA methyltransferase